MQAEADESWSGVRRYFVEKNSSVLVGDLKEANLADPQILYDFIKWGMLSYPADKYMLILGGHGYQFVGMITDYSRKAPYLMGIPEMARAIDLAANKYFDKFELIACYKRLGFAQDNCWSRLLSNKHLYKNMIKTAQKENLFPLKMKPEEVCAYISKLCINDYTTPAIMFAVADGFCSERSYCLL